MGLREVSLFLTLYPLLFLSILFMDWPKDIRARPRTSHECYGLRWECCKQMAWCPNHVCLICLDEQTDMFTKSQRLPYPYTNYAFAFHNFYLPLEERDEGKLTWLRSLAFDCFYIKLTYQTEFTLMLTLSLGKETRVVFLHMYMCWDLYLLCIFPFSCIKANSDKHLDLLPIPRSICNESDWN